MILEQLTPEEKMWMRRSKKLVIGLLIVLLVAVLWPFGVVNAGERGILLRFGAVTNKVFNEGLYIKTPLIEKVVKADVRVQKEQIDAEAASQDLQTVTSTVALNYHVDPGSVARLYQEVGLEYKVRIIDPAIQEAVKASTAQFTAEHLITQREVVREEIKTLLKEKLQGRGLMIDEFNIVNFDFSKTFNDAIEAKVTAEQNALASKNKLEQVKYEADQAVALAKGKAEAQKIEGDALRANPEVLQLRAIEKWKGEVPTYWGGNALPFINIK